MSLEDKINKVLLKKYFQDGVVQGVRLLSTSLSEPGIINDYEIVKKKADEAIKNFTEQIKSMSKSKEPKQPEYIFAEHRQAYVKHITDRNWDQKDYIYLRDAEQLGGTMTPIVHWVGNYGNNPKFEAVRKMVRERTFKNEGE